MIRGYTDNMVMRLVLYFFTNKKRESRLKTKPKPIFRTCLQHDVHKVFGFVIKTLSLVSVLKRLVLGFIK
jgi:hypothetical protein